jgi:uncharacterized membrane protein
MTTVERSVYVDAPSEAIDAVTLDPDRLPDWYVGVQRVEPDGVYPEPGGRVVMIYRAAGVSFDITMTSLEGVPGEYYLFGMEGMIAGTNRWTHTPEGSGTRLTVTFDYEVPGGGLGQALDRLLIERMNTDQLEKSLANLKALVEGGE